MISTLRALPRTVWLVGLISLVNDSAGEMVYSIVPLYLSTVLMAGPRALGIIEGIAETVSSLLKLFAGVFADKFGKIKIWIITGYGIASVARPLIAFGNSWLWILFCRFSDRVGKGLRSAPRDALLNLSVDSSQRGLVYGIHRNMDNAGAVIGPLLAATLLALGMPLKQIFLVAFIPAIFVVILTLGLREPEPSAALAPSQKFSWQLDGFPPRFKRYLIVLALFTLGNSSGMFLLLRARELGLPDYQVPILWALVSFVAAVFSAPLSALSDRVGRTRLIISGWIIYAAFYFLLGIMHDQAWTLWLLFASLGLSLAATEGTEKALVADLAPKELSGTAFGWYNMVMGLLLLPASWIFGELWERFSPLTAFSFGAGCALSAAILLRFWVRPQKM